jgi:hypothetical protein
MGTIAIGFKAHSGWAAAVVIADRGSDSLVIERRRIELVPQADASWAKQPYHSAQGLASDCAREVVQRGMQAARSAASHEIESLVMWSHGAGHEIVACAVLIGSPLPPWTTEDILAVHLRMHQAEGFLFPDALARAVSSRGLKLLTIPEKQLAILAEKSLGKPFPAISAEVAALGKSVGPPWGKDQKNAALAAMIALKTRHSTADHKRGAASSRPR